MRHPTLLLRLLRALVLLLLLGFLALLPLAAIHAAGVIYVVPGGTGTQTGADWASAKDLQAALTSAASDDEIWVKAGTYTPTASSDRTAMFQLKSGVALYGGFVGTENSRNQRNVAANVTILSGDLLSNDAGAAASNNATRGENSFHVVSGSGTDATAVIDGFIITGGNANGAPALRQNIGGGIFGFQGSPSVCHVTIQRNSATFGGGGIGYDEGSALVCFATISDNTADDSGGGVFIRDGINAVIYHTSLIGNRAPTGAGVVPIVQHTVVSLSFFGGNAASQAGGGMAFGTGTVTISQVVFSGNTAVLAGSAIASDLSSPTISQVVFSNNQSLNGGGTLSNQRSSPIIRNSIFWGNQGGQIVNYLTGNNPNVQYSLMQGGYITGTHILDADPLFVDADGADNIAGTPDDDLRLQAGSPAIDAGNNAFIPADLTDDNTNGNLSEPAPFDLAGNPRLFGPTVDLGAYEWQGAPISPPKRVYLALITAIKTVSR